MISDVENASFSHHFCVKTFSSIRQFSLFVLDGCIVFLRRTQRTHSTNIAGHDRPKAVVLNDELKVVRPKVINFYCYARDIHAKSYRWFIINHIFYWLTSYCFDKQEMWRGKTYNKRGVILVRVQIFLNVE